MTLTNCQIELLFDKLSNRPSVTVHWHHQQQQQCVCISYLNILYFTYNYSYLLYQADSCSKIICFLVNLVLAEELASNLVAAVQLAKILKELNKQQDFDTTTFLKQLQSMTSLELRAHAWVHSMQIPVFLFNSISYSNHL